MKKEIKLFLMFSALFLGLVSTGLSQTDNSNSWTQFRGQKRGGISTKEISKSKLNLLWKKDVGSGFSELLVSEGKIYSMASEMTDSVSGFEYVVSFDEKTGNELWRSNVDSIFLDVDGWGDGPRSTPVIDDNYVYSLSSYGKLSANSKKDGKLIWQVDFLKEYSSTTPRWGFSTSPVLIEDKIIVEVGGPEGKVFGAFNNNDGKMIWLKGDGTSSYNSPLVATINGEEQIIFANGTYLHSYNANGDTLWKYQMPFGHMSAMPVLVDENKIFVSTIRTTGFILIEINNNVATEVTKGNSMKNDFSSSCYYDGNIYGFHVAALRCISAETGEAKWTKRGYGKGSLILVGDKLFVLSDKGKLIIAEASPNEFKEVSSIAAIKGKSWTAPSFANGKVYVRNLTEMACYELK